MKKVLSVMAVLFTMLAILVSMYSNSDTGRNIYKKYICRQLSGGIDKLFSGPNKYITPHTPERYVGKWNFFFLQKNNVGFEEMKNFILDNYYKGREIDYEIKVIVQYQDLHEGSDANNPDFHRKSIYFIKETEENRNLDFATSSNKMFFERKEDRIIATTQNILTQNLDTFFSNKIFFIASFLLISAAALNIFICLKYDC